MIVIGWISFIILAASLVIKTIEIKPDDRYELCGAIVGFCIALLPIIYIGFTLLGGK